MQRLFDLQAVNETLDRLPGRKGRHRLRRTLSAYDGRVPHLRSEAERRFLTLCEKYELPQPEVNASIEGYEVDFVWRAQKLAVEVDGAAVHYTARAFTQDRQRDRALAALGIHVVRVTWHDLDDAAALAQQLEAILARR